MNSSPTKLVVGGAIGVALLAAAFTLAGLKWGFVLCVLLAYEGWTLVNKYPNDTISEIVWTFAKRPMVPWVFGVASGWAISSGFIPATKDGLFLCAALFFLQGHFFFQRFEGD